MSAYAKDSLRVMRDQDQRVLLLEFIDEPHTLLHKEYIAYAEGLVGSAAARGGAAAAEL